MSTEQERTRALEKIQKLLRLAKDGRGDATEAATALRQAQSLMRKFNIDEADAIQHSLDNDPDALVAAWKTAGKSTKLGNIRADLPMWANLVSFGVGKLYDCRCVIQAVRDEKGNLGKAFVFAGYKTDVQIACWTFEYLCDCIRRSSARFEAACVQAFKGNRAGLQEFGIIDWDTIGQLEELSTKSRLGQFRRNMASELQGRLMELKRERDAHLKANLDAEAGVNTSTALAVINNKLARIEEKFGPTEDGTHTFKRFSGASLAGRLEGNRIDLNPSPLEHEKEERAALR